MPQESFINGPNYSRGGKRPTQPSSRRSTGLRSAEALRHARESRYSRDQEVLCASLSSCTQEPSEKQLQISALERIRQELENRLHDYDLRARELRDQLGGRVGSDEEPRDSLLRQRLVVEHRLSTTRDELAEVTKELERLRSDLHSSGLDSCDSASASSSAAPQSDANLSLFFQNSATRRPLRTSMRPYSTGHINRAGLPRSLKRDHIATHLRSKSLTEDYTPPKLPRKADKRAGVVSSYPVLESRTSPRRLGSSSVQTPLPIDEFNNSFSSRVIDPSCSRPRPRSRLRPLQMPSRERRNTFASHSRRSSIDGGEFGNATLLPIAAPRSTAELLEELPSTPLPSYVQALITEFEQVSHSHLALSLTGDRTLDTPVARKPAPLSPVLEERSPLSSIKTRSSPKDPGRILLRKQRPIFTLRLPSHPSGNGSPSLFASSSTSIDASSEEQPSPMPLINSSNPLRRKGLPSTRDHDLAMLGGAPDDVPETPRPVLYEPKPTPVSKSKAGRPMSVLSRVKNRLVQLGRR